LSFRYQEDFRGVSLLIDVILSREELTIDYGWDKDEFDIPHHVFCLCEKPKCRGFLMRAKNKKYPENSERKPP
jgi:hypothetical protein